MTHPLDDDVSDRRTVKLPTDTPIEADMASWRVHRIGASLNDSFEGIMLAACAYPIVVSVVIFCWIIATQEFDMPRNSGELNNLIVGTIAGGLIGSIAGGLLAIFASIVVLMCLMIFEWTMRRPFLPRTGAALCGGLTGYAATFWISFPILMGPKYFVNWFWLPPLAMVMGQIGAIYSAALANPKIYGATNATYPPFQFQVLQLMAATAWVAAVLAIERLGDNFVLASWLMVGIGLQILLLLADRWWVNRFR